jgi:hypothetical protein
MLIRAAPRMNEAPACVQVARIYRSIALKVVHFNLGVDRKLIALTDQRSCPHGTWQA